MSRGQAEVGRVVRRRRRDDTFGDVVSWRRSGQRRPASRRGSLRRAMKVMVVRLGPVGGQALDLGSKLAQALAQAIAAGLRLDLLDADGGAVRPTDLRRRLHHAVFDRSSVAHNVSSFDHLTLPGVANALNRKARWFAQAETEGGRICGQEASGFRVFSSGQIAILLSPAAGPRERWSPTPLVAGHAAQDDSWTGGSPSAETKENGPAFQWQVGTTPSPVRDGMCIEPGEGKLSPPQRGGMCFGLSERGGSALQHGAPPRLLPSSGAWAIDIASLRNGHPLVTEGRSDLAGISVGVGPAHRETRWKPRRSSLRSLR